MLTATLRPQCERNDTTTDRFRQAEFGLVITLLVYNGQNSADEVKQIAMTQSSVCHPIGTGLGLRTMITLRCERHMWTVPQACQAAPSKACRAASAITGTR